MSITRSDFALLEATGKNLEVRNDLKNDLIKGNKKLHNRSAKGSANDEADAVDDKSERRSHVKDGVYEWYGPTGKLHSAPIQEGADVIMVKPGLCYLDIMARTRQRYDVPLAVYNVSGECAMLAAARRVVDPDLALLESLDCCLRAGADMIITYFARRATQLIDRIT